MRRILTASRWWAACQRPSRPLPQARPACSAPLVCTSFGGVGCTVDIIPWTKPPATRMRFSSKPVL